MKQILYSNWNRMGRMGNQFFQLCALNYMAEKYNREPIIPREWKYQQYFKHQVKMEIPRRPPEEIGEPSYEFPGWEHWDEKEKSAGGIFNIGGWLQSSRYFNKDIAKKLFEFTDEFRDKMWAKWEHVFRKPVICIQFRVGKDYVENGNYEILPILYQISALYKWFPNWREEYNILVCSDDMQYARLNMDCADNIYFAEGIDIEQMFLATCCTHFILANSTFSWWGAFLSDKENSIIVRPSKYFKGHLEKTHSTRDFWESHWKTHYYLGERLRMEDVVFTIPVSYDHEDRKHNLILIYKWLNENFSTNIHLGENGIAVLQNIKGWNSYTGFTEKEFHRTKMLNDMAESRVEPIVINFDCDNVCPILQMMIGVDMIRKGEADMVYPYDGRVARVARDRWYDRLLETSGDCGIFGGEVFKGTRSVDQLSVGHIIIWNKDRFFEGGGENEHFVSYGPEDVERYERFNKLEFNIKRVKGIVYHIDHWCGNDSSGGNPRFGRNYSELERIKKMNKDQLIEEIRTWDWVKKEREPV